VTTCPVPSIIILVLQKTAKVNRCKPPSTFFAESERSPLQTFCLSHTDRVPSRQLLREMGPQRLKHKLKSHAAASLLAAMDDGVSLASEEPGMEFRAPIARGLGLRNSVDALPDGKHASEGGAPLLARKDVCGVSQTGIPRCFTSAPESAIWDVSALRQAPGTHN
jgi:hypothetical protein